MPEPGPSARASEAGPRMRITVPGSDMVREVARRTGASEGEALASLWRTSKRHGETLTVFAGELREQFARETAAKGE